MKKPVTIKAFEKVWDFGVVPLLIFAACFSPHFAHGRILALESGQHLAWAHAILQGKVPYRDIWMLYGPLQEYSIAFLMKLFGATLAVQRAYFHIGIILALIVGYFLARLIIRNRLFTYITTWLLITETVWPFWMSRWGGFRVGFGLLGMLFLVLYNNRRKKRYLYAAGILTIMAFLNSVEYGVILFGVSIAYLGGSLFIRREHRLKATGAEIGIYLLGILTILAPLTLYYHKEGALKECRRIIVQDSMVRYSQNTIRFVSKAKPGKGVPWVERKQVNWATEKLKFIKSLNFKFYLYLIVFAFTGLYLVKRFFQRKFTFSDGSIAVLGLFSIGAFVVGLRRFPSPQFSSGLSGLIILTGFFLYKGSAMIYTTVKDFKLKKIAASEAFAIHRVLVCIGVALLLWYYLLPANYTRGMNFIKGNWQKYGHKPQGLVPLGIPAAGGAWVPPDQAQRIESVVAYIRKHTVPGEHIYVFPFEAFYYLFTDRGCPTRFPVAISAGPRQWYEHEVIADLEKDKTGYIIYGIDSYRIPDTNPIDNENHIKLVVRYIKEHYDVETQIGGTLILRRKGDGRTRLD